MLKYISIITLIAATILSCGDKMTKSMNSPRNKVKTNPFYVHFNALTESDKDRYSDSIKLYFTNYLELDDLNGMFLVAKNGKIIFERYKGFANKADQLKISPSTPMHVASISKVITAIATLRLVDQGKIDLDKDIRSYIPTIPYEGITARMLLNHRSGIPYYAYFPVEIWPYNKVMTNQNVVEVLNEYKIPLYFPPNTQFSYCNTNYAILALIIEKVTEEKFPMAMYKLIFQPLKMKNSFIYEKWRESSKHANSYDERGRLEDITNLDYVYGDKNLYTTARDLLLLDKATYSDTFLSKKMKAEMLKGYSYERPGKSNYGLGMRIREDKGKSTFFFHTGWWHGNTGCYATLRADTVCMIVLSNQYTKKVFQINRLSTLFGNYPFESLIDTKENFIQPEDAKEQLIKKYAKPKETSDVEE
jgi:CubicO group peptidase (beta-lactamase class C family)